MARDRISKYCYPAISYAPHCTARAGKRRGEERYTFGFNSFSSASALLFLTAAGLGGAAAAFLSLSSSFWRFFWRFLSSDLETRSPVTSSKWRLATASVGGAEASGASAIIAVCCCCVVERRATRRDGGVEVLEIFRGGVSHEVLPVDRVRTWNRRRHQINMISKILCTFLNFQSS